MGTMENGSIDKSSGGVKHNKLNDEVLGADSVDASERVADPKSMIAATHDTDEAKATAPPKAQVSREEIGLRK